MSRSEEGQRESEIIKNTYVAIRFFSLQRDKGRNKFIIEFSNKEYESCVIIVDIGYFLKESALYPFGKGRIRLYNLKKEYIDALHDVVENGYVEIIVGGVTSDKAFSQNLGKYIITNMSTYRKEPDSKDTYMELEIVNAIKYLIRNETTLKTYYDERRNSILEDLFKTHVSHFIDGIKIRTYGDAFYNKQDYIPSVGNRIDFLTAHRRRYGLNGTRIKNVFNKIIKKDMGFKWFVSRESLIGAVNYTDPHSGSFQGIFTPETWRGWDKGLAKNGYMYYIIVTEEITDIPIRIGYNVVIQEMVDGEKINGVITKLWHIKEVFEDTQHLVIKVMTKEKAPEEAPIELSDAETENTEPVEDSEEVEQQTVEEILQDYLEDQSYNRAGYLNDDDSITSSTTNLRNVVSLNIRTGPFTRSEKIGGIGQFAQRYIENITDVPIQSRQVLKCSPWAGKGYGLYIPHYKDEHGITSVMDGDDTYTFIGLYYWMNQRGWLPQGYAQGDFLLRMPDSTAPSTSPTSPAQFLISKEGNLVIQAKSIKIEASAVGFTIRPDTTAEVDGTITLEGTNIKLGVNATLGVPLSTHTHECPASPPGTQTGPPSAVSAKVKVE